MLALSSTRLHIGIKLLISLLASISALLLKTPESLSLVLAVSTLYAICQVSHKTLLKTYLVLSATALVYLGFTQLMLHIPNHGYMFQSPLIKLLIPFYRIGITTNTALTLAFSSELSDLLRQLNRLRLSTFISIPLSVAVRFLPTFFSDIAQIYDINRLRFNGQPFLLQLLRPVRFWRTFCVPLIFRALHSTDALALSATLKGVGKKGGLATLPKDKVRFRDLFVLVVWIGIVGGALTWQSLLSAAQTGGSHVH